MVKTFILPGSNFTFRGFDHWDKVGKSRVQTLWRYGGQLEENTKVVWSAKNETEDSLVLAISFTSTRNYKGQRQSPWYPAIYKAGV